MGGIGILPNQLAELTPDQIWFLACERDMLKKKPYEGRVKKLETWESAALVDDDDMLKGRTADGTLIRLPLTKGKSVAQRVRERLAAEKQAAEAKQRKRKR